MKLILTFLLFTIALHSSDIKKIKLELLWTDQFEFAGFYMAKEKGFYKEKNLDVEILDGFKKNTLDDVESGKIEFGISSSKIIYEVNKGRDFVALASIFQKSPYAWVVTKDSNIKSLKDFVGKTVMHAKHSLDNIELLAILKANGIDSTKINFIPTSYNIDDLIDKKCDISSSYVSNEPYELEKHNIEYKLFTPAKYGVDFYGDVLFTSQKYLNNNPQTVKDFREASLKGWEYAFENVEETIKLIKEKYNPSLSLSKLRYEANILKQQSLYPFIAVGTMDKKRWQTIANTFKDLGYLDTANVPNEFIYTQNQDNSIYQQWIIKIVLFFIFIIALIYFIFKKHTNYLKQLVKERTIKLEIEKKNYEALSMGSIDGVLIIKDGRFIKANDAILKMLHYDDRDEFLNIHPSKLSPEFQPDGERSNTKTSLMIDNCLKNGSHRFEWVHTKKGGENFWCDISLTKIEFEDDTVIHVLYKDISRQKALEEHLEEEVRDRTRELEIAMRTKSDFLANMSHEIRTPLNAIKGFVDILYKSEIDEQKQKKLKIIKESSDSLLTIINDILDFSKIDNHKLLVEQIPLNIRDVFNQVVELFFQKAQEKNILIKIKIDENLPDNTLGDIVRIKQVFSNILSNAIKFAYDESVINIEISYKTKTKELLCKISDNGIGIDEKNIDNIFNTFTQEDSTTTRKFGGTGLGLSISKALVELMGGEIGVKSKLNEGSCFYFTLPIFEVIQKQEIQIEEEINETELNGMILIVEDNKSNQMLMGMLLDDFGLDSEVANDGLEAIKAVKNTKYDLILMDENMPNMNGIEATKQIKLLDGIKQIPIIAVTANALKGDKEKFLDAGMDDYLPKPIDSDELEKMIRKYL
ncbi:MAG: ABC transporter substrate-binding protein [Campylobacterota bacterium]|nr:ABC transporter substrate-binding protein [Campylobacterota bacterium]